MFVVCVRVGESKCVCALKMIGRKERSMRASSVADAHVSPECGESVLWGVCDGRRRAPRTEEGQLAFDEGGLSREETNRQNQA